MFHVKHIFHKGFGISGLFLFHVKQSTYHSVIEEK